MARPRARKGALMRSAGLAAIFATANATLPTYTATPAAVTCAAGETGYLASSLCPTGFSFVANTAAPTAAAGLVATCVSGTALPTYFSSFTGGKMLTSTGGMTTVTLAGTSYAYLLSNSQTAASVYYASGNGAGVNRIANTATITATSMCLEDYITGTTHYLYNAPCTALTVAATAAASQVMGLVCVPPPSPPSPPPSPPHPPPPFPPSPPPPVKAPPPANQASPPPFPPPINKPPTPPPPAGASGNLPNCGQPRKPLRREDAGDARGAPDARRRVGVAFEHAQQLARHAVVDGCRGEVQ